MPGESVPSNINVLADAQFTNVRILKPFPGFEAVYQGKSAGLPICFPGERDPEAGRPGFDPNLMAGIKVPLGARVLLWIPMAVGAQGGFQEYIYRVAWRYSTLRKYRSPGRADIPRAPYHMPVQSPGVPDTTGGGNAPRVIVPASWRNVAFEQAEQASPSNGRVDLRPEEIAVVAPALVDFAQPLLPDGSAGVVQQGVFDPALDPVPAPMPGFQPFWFDAEGDEMLIFANRVNFEEPVNWDFTDAAADLFFSNVYGTGNGTHPDSRVVGIYLVTGANP